MKTFVNLTPHDICVMKDGDTVLHLAPSGQIARCSEQSDSIGLIDGIPVVIKTFGEITGLPEKQKDTIYIVSLLVMQAAQRADVMCPGDPIRNEKGVIIGCQSLCMHPKFS